MGKLERKEGLRRAVKDGILTVEEAHKILEKRGCPLEAPVRAWLNRRKK
jgi:hypothetical protein